MAEKRYESDLTNKEKRQLEWKKLKTMTWGERIQYLWAYYKIWLAALIAVIFVVWIGVTSWQNSQMVVLLSVAVADTTLDSSEGAEKMEEDLIAYLGTGDSKETISLDTTVQSGDDYTAVIKKTVVMATGSTDVLICGEDMYNEYEEQGAFVSWEEVLGDDYASYESKLVDGKLDLSTSPKWKDYGMTEYEPVYAAVLASSENQANAAKMAEYFLD